MARLIGKDKEMGSSPSKGDPGQMGRSGHQEEIQAEVIGRCQWKSSKGWESEENQESKGRESSEGASGEVSGNS